MPRSNLNFLAASFGCGASYGAEAGLCPVYQEADDGEDDEKHDDDREDDEVARHIGCSTASTLLLGLVGNFGRGLCLYRVAR